MICSICDSSRDSNRALVEWRLLKNSHGTVPDDRSSIAQSTGKMGHCLHADVHPDQTYVCKFNRNRFSYDLLTFDGLVTINYLVIRWQQQLDSFLLRSLLDVQCSLKHIIFNQRLTYSKAFGLQECVGHRAADQNLVHASVNQRIDHGNFVRDLRSAKYRHKGMFRVVDDAAQVIEFLLHQQSGRCMSNILRDSGGGGMSAVRRTKGIVHINIAKA